MESQKKIFFSSFFRSFFSALIIFTCCIGPSLIIAGIVVLVIAGPSARAANVQSYDTAAQAKFFMLISSLLRLPHPFSSFPRLFHDGLEIMMLATPLQSFAMNVQDFSQVQYTFFGAQFSLTSRPDLLADSGSLTDYKHVAFVLTGVSVDNITATDIVITSSYPLAGQQVDLGVIMTTDSLSATKTDLNCTTPGDCTSLSGSALALCNAMLPCDKGQDLISGFRSLFLL